MIWRDYLRPGERRTLDRIEKLEAEVAGKRKVRRALYDRCRKRMAKEKNGAT